jgi:hypothetical protein
MRRRLLAQVAVLWTFVAACSPGTGVSSLLNQRDLPLRIGAQQAEFAPALIGLDDLRSFPGLPPGFQPLLAGDTLHEDPDPRAPCGEKLSTPLLSNGAWSAFQLGTKASWVVVEAIWNLDPGVAQGLISAVRADIRPGCPAFQSGIESGRVLLNRFVGQVQLLNVGDDRVAVLGSTAPGDGTLTFTLGAWVREGDDLIYVSVACFKTIAPAVIKTLTVVATQKFEHLP